VADCRALTPTEAAERIVPHRDEFLDALRTLEDQLRTLLFGRLERVRSKLQDLAGRRPFRLPLEVIRGLERGLDDEAERLHRAIQRRVSVLRDHLAAKAAQLETLSPLNVLGRGYSLTRREGDGVVVRSPEQVQPGERLVTRLQHGQIFSRVEQPEGS